MIVTFERKEYKETLVRKNPILFGSGWFLCWNEEDVCEFVIKSFKASTQESCRKRMVSILNKIGCDWKRIGESVEERIRSFPPFWGDSCKAYVFDIVINMPIPINDHYQLNH